MATIIDMTTSDQLLSLGQFLRARQADILAAWNGCDSRHVAAPRGYDAARSRHGAAARPHHYCCGASSRRLRAFPQLV